MPRELPNLDWLRVFAATAATESFSGAAGALNVTAGAVSQRIKSLEAFLGIELFQRYAQGVRLTDAGRRYAEDVREPLEHLLAATRNLTSADTKRTVKLTVLPALAQLWLGPRVNDFHQSHEGATLEIWADPAVIDLRTSDFDLALRYANPPFAGCDHQPMLFDALVPVAAPGLLEHVDRTKDGLPIDAPLMLDTYWAHDFDNWLQATGCERPANLKTRTFSLYSMALDATLDGHGFMIGHTALISDLVVQGRLVPLSGHLVPASHQFHLLTSSGAQSNGTAQAFVEWVAAQARLTELTTARIFNQLTPAPSP